MLWCRRATRPAEENIPKGASVLVGVSAFLLLVAVTSAYAAGTAQVAPDEIKAMFANGRPFTAVSTSGKVYVLTLNPDGTAQERPKEKQAGKTGTWRLSGNGYCSKWGVHTEKRNTVARTGGNSRCLIPADT